MKPAGRAARALLIASVFALAASSLAAVECRMDESLTTCVTRMNKEAREAREQRAKTAATSEDATNQANQLASKPTGVQTGRANLASNTTNFIPLMSLTGLLGQAKQGDTPGTYVFDLNFLIPGLAMDKNSKFQAVVNSQPMVADAVKSQLPEAKRDELVKAIEGGLGDLADYSLILTYAWVDRSHGRGFNQYRNRYAALATAVSKQFVEAVPEAVGLDKVGTQTLPAIKRNYPAVTGDLFNKSFQDLNAMAAGAGTELKGAVEKAAGDEMALLESDREIRRKAGLGHFADLLDNQPQLTFSASKSFRDPVLGGDETSGKLNYEWGRANLNNALSSDCQRSLDTPATDKIDKETLSRCLAEYTKFVNDNATALKDGDKFSFSAEYLNVGKEVFDLPKQGLTGLKIDAAKKLIISAGWSHLFPDPAGGDQPVRLDFVGSYENVSNDPQRQDRGVATLTFTRKFGTISVPLGLVYANHGEFLGDVDKQFSAHVGLKFDLGGTQTPTGQ
ncbi:MAG TPA: hypothetical protein VIA62_26290 [Thermoanaerobaculia bacterium]|jgi:hypothetical protein|nr:hypothetical protein [Thermoanaerobaculia bacterium]